MLCMFIEPPRLRRLPSAEVQAVATRAVAWSRLVRRRKTSISRLVDIVKVSCKCHGLRLFADGHVPGGSRRGITFRSLVYPVRWQRRCRQNGGGRQHHRHRGVAHRRIQTPEPALIVHYRPLAFLCLSSRLRFVLSPHSLSQVPSHRRRYSFSLVFGHAR